MFAVENKKTHAHIGTYMYTCSTIRDTMFVPARLGTSEYCTRYSQMSIYIHGSIYMYTPPIDSRETSYINLMVPDSGRQVFV